MPLDRHAFGVPAAPASPRNEAHDASAVELTGDLRSEHGRELRRLRVHAEPDQDVGEVDPRRPDVDDHLAVACLGLRNVLDGELIRPADALQNSGPHAQTATSQTSGKSQVTSCHLRLDQGQSLMVEPGLEQVASCNLRCHGPYGGCASSRGTSVR